MEAGILEQVAFHDQVADVRSRYLLAAGGKRVRPVLTLLTAQLGDGVTDDVVTAAQAVEILHVGSLYHDDVMDEASERRGVPSAQQVWGNSVAILTGDLLFARASKLIAGAAAATGSSRRRRCSSASCSGSCTRPSGRSPTRTPSTTTCRCSRTRRARSSPPRRSGAPPTRTRPARTGRRSSTFGRRIGVAFQLIDDVIDLAPDEAETGKHPGTDLKAGVPTLPLLLLRRRAATDAGRPGAARPHRRAAADGSGREVAEVVAELRAHPVTAETRAEALRWADSAKAALDALPAGTVRRALVRFADLLVDRSN